MQGELAKVGIAKNRRNSQQGYNFRGIDEVYAALSPLLASHGLIIVPRMIDREVVERQSAKGGALFNVTVKAEFDFISADDGSIHVASTYGEAMDSADKATNKAMSAAYKYAAFMTFAIPTEGDNDADGTTHEVAPRAVQGHRQGAEVSPEQPASDNDVTRIIQLCTVVGGNIQADILKGYHIKNMTELPASKVAGVVKRLNEKIEEKAKAQTNAEFKELVDDEIPY